MDPNAFRPAFVARLRARLASLRAEREQGSLLLDVLLGIAIFALIALIAVSAVNSYRLKAYETGVTSDAHDLGMALTAEQTADGTLTDPTQTLPSGYTLTTHGGTTNQVASFTDEGDGNFAFCVVHADDNGDANAYAVYDSAQGGLVERGSGDGVDLPDACAGSGGGSAGTSACTVYASIGDDDGNGGHSGVVSGVSVQIYGVGSDGYATTCEGGNEALSALYEYLGSTYGQKGGWIDTGEGEDDYGNPVENPGSFSWKPTATVSVTDLRAAIESYINSVLTGATFDD